MTTFGPDGDDANAGILRGRYRLRKVIGRGGLGSVYRARDQSLGRKVAVQIFDTTATSKDDIHLQENEVNALASLTHHSLVTLFDAGVDRSDPDRPHIYFRGLLCWPTVR
ncbi:protein kinase domain-containing protein [Cryobacterium adonitolivorans]|uniref:protein kinase domain-containing protein n=1 Tax=Cryobacterium adonitolivorans TaxID=1259189 RepID=UPI00141BEB27|nr:hypothetical protein [Cryobacterium adonitolivorans]